MAIRSLLLIVVLGVLAQALPVLAAEGVPAIKTVEIGKNREFRVNGEPFFPLMLWAQSPLRIKDGLSISVNTFAGNGSSASNREFLAQLAENGLYGVFGLDREIVGHSHFLGWIHGDEPDMPQGEGDAQAPRKPPEVVAASYRKLKDADSSRPVFVTFTGSFFEKASRYDEATRARIYPQYMKSCDVAGFDIYPIFGSGYPSRLNWVADATEELVRLAGAGRAVYAWIETNKGSKWMTLSKQLDVEPKHTRCEVWMSIIRGATAIGYFTHRWRPDYKQFAPEGEMVVELKRLNDQITRLAPAILADPASTRIGMSMSGGLPCHFKATEYQGAVYIFAQNIDLGPEPETKRQFEQIVARAGKAVISVSGLKAGTRIEVIDENRTITAEEGKFTDDFAPLTEHIYKLKL